MNSKLGRQHTKAHWQPLSVHLWASYTYPTHDVNDVMCEGWPHHRGLRSLLFSNSDVGSFMSHKNQISVSAWDGTYGFSPLSEKTRKSNRLQMSLQRQLFLLSYLKTLSVGPTGVQTRDLPLSRPALSHAWMKLNMYQWWPEKRINNTTLKKKKINQRCLHPFQLDLARRLVPAVLPLPTHNKHIISPILFREISINFYKVYLTFRQQSSITYIVYVHILYSASNKMDKDFLV